MSQRRRFSPLLFVVLQTVVAAHAAPGDVQRTLDAPCRYPSGLATDGTRLFVADWRAGEIHQVAPAGGAVEKSFAAPALKPAGLAWGDGKLFVSDDHTGWVYALNPQTGVVEHSFEAPGSRPTGLAYAHGRLFILERKAGQVYQVSPEDGTIHGYFAAPNDTCTCLTHDGQYLWAADRVNNELYLVSPVNGQVLGIVEAPGPHAAGLAWLEGLLWNVDFQTRKLYALAVRNEPKPRLTDTRTARVEFLWSLYNYGPGEVRNLRIGVALPGTLPQQELLSEIQFSQPPTQTAADQWGQRCAVFDIPAVPAGTRQTLSYSVNARVSAIRYLIFPDAVGTLADIPAEIRQAYTADGARYGVNTPFVQETARTIVGDERNAYWIARRIFNHVIDKLEYEMAGGWDVPEVVLKRGLGSCSEYTFTFIALCRAAGLPARYEGSIVVRGDDASIDEAFHRWAQVYLPGYGWVPVDANRGDAKSPADQARGFGELTNRFLITTQGGGDSTYLGWGYNSFAKYQATGYCKIEEENFGFWEPLTPTSAPAGAAGAPPGGAGRP